MRTLSYLILWVALPAMAETHGVLRVVEGTVKVTSAKTGKTTAAQVDQNVMVKDIITTGKNGRAKAIMDDNTAFNVGPDSSLEIRQYITGFSQADKKDILNVIAGKVRFDVQQKFDGEKNQFLVITPTATAGVRGTDFLVEYETETKNATVTTFKGTVEFGLTGPRDTIQNPVRVFAGMTSKISRGGAASVPSQVHKAQLEKIKSDPDTNTDKPRPNPEPSAKQRKERVRH